MPWWVLGGHAGRRVVHANLIVQSASGSAKWTHDGLRAHSTRLRSALGAENPDRPDNHWRAEVGASGVPGHLFWRRLRAVVTDARQEPIKSPSLLCVDGAVS